MTQESPLAEDAAMTRLAKAAVRTDSRLRLRSTIEACAPWLPLPPLVVLGLLTYLKVARPSLETEHWMVRVVAGGLLLTAALVLALWFRRRPKHAGSLALDRRYDLADRITNALSFRSLPAPELTPLMRAAIADAAALPNRFEPRRAAPLRVPQEAWVAFGLVVAIWGISTLEVQTLRVIPLEPVTEKLVLAPDDVDLFRDVADELAEGARDPEHLARVREFNQLIEDLAQRHLSRRDAFARLGRLQRELGDAADLDREAFDEGLQSLARELEKSDLSKPLAQALAERRLSDAEKAARELAERLRSPRQKPPSKERLESLRRALERASRQSNERLKQIAERIAERRAELAQAEKRLLRKKGSEKDLDPGGRRELEQRKRELERLERRRHQVEQSARRFSELDRELQEAAAALMKELGPAAEDLDAAAENLNRMAREELTQEQKEALKNRLKELLEVLRQQGKGGDTRMERLLRFGRRARGAGSGTDAGKPGKPTQGLGRGAKIAGIELGRGGLPIPVGQGSGQSGSEAGSESSGSASGVGKDHGSGHDPNLRGAETQLEVETHDVSAAGIDTGQGKASAEVIFSAAQRGFTGQAYGNVFTDYRTVAEEGLTDDEIPPGHRFYVRRYFQLIRPRD